MQYYLFHSQKRHGPFTLEQLATQPFPSDAKVWHQGLTDWVQPHDVPELREHLPPPDPVVAEAVPAATLQESPPPPPTARRTVARSPGHAAQPVSPQRPVAAAVVAPQRPVVSPAAPETDPIRILAETHRRFTIRVLILMGVQTVLGIIPYGVLLFLPLIGVQLWLMLDMAKAMSLRSIWIWAVGTCIPCIGSFVLLALSMQGTSRLQAAGVKVGLLGAQLPPRI